MFFRSAYCDPFELQARNAVYANVHLPPITLYRTKDGGVHFCDMGEPFVVEYLKVATCKVCSKCPSSDSYKELFEAEKVFSSLVDVVKDVERRIVAFQECKDDPEGNLRPLGNILRTLYFATDTVSSVSGSGQHLGSFPDAYLQTIRSFKLEIENFLRSTEGRTRTRQQISTYANIVPLLDATVMFEWESFNGIRRAAAVAYGTDIGGGIGIVCDPHTVGILKSSMAPVAILSGTSFSREVLEAAAALWTPDDLQSAFADGAKLLEAAKILTGSTS